MLRRFRVKGKKHTYDFWTQQEWAGLWAPLTILSLLTEPDGHYQDHSQVQGTCDLYGEHAVRDHAREMIKDFEEMQELSAS